MTLERKFTCTFCDKTFSRESWYKKHMCEKKRRFIKANEITSISGHRLFNHWQRRAKLLRRGKEKTMTEFVRSPYYNTFITLAEFVSRVNVITGYSYVDWLVDNKVPERKWTDNEGQGMQDYFDYIRKTEDPETQATSTCKSIKDWCELKGINSDIFFEKITPGQALNMVRANELSPWVLFGYTPCVEGLVSRIGDEVLFTLDDHISVRYWIDKVAKEKDNAVRVTECCDKKLRDAITG